MMKEKANSNLVLLGSRLVLAVALVLCTLGNVSAQTVVRESGFSDRYLQNNIGSDWFVGVNGGARIYFGDHNRQMELSDRFSAGGGLYLGKWWTSVIGTRIGYSLQTIKGVTQTGVHATRTDEYLIGRPHYLYEQKFKAGHLYGDALFNVSNLFFGLKPERVYTLSPYIGLGWMRTWDNPQADAVSANIGLLNLFRLSSKLDFALDIRGALVDDHFDGEVGGREQEGLLSIDLSLAYRFGKTVSRPEPSGMSSAELAALNERLNQVRQENATLRDQITTQSRDLQGSYRTQIERITEWKDVASDVYIRFELGKSDLSKEARVQLGFLADLLRTYTEGTYTITGYADAFTGTPAINARLSRTRADVVKNCLIREFGIDGSRLKIVAAGGVDTQYYNDPALSRSVVIRPNK
ncbi:MAG: OmpA family protein [Dysgonamonadaceae bacterium]|jgi:outer membrane protein OmpA-like peptidoglycan-associated protein|nr:OmpA family protein [Dysgonamonadaceae bacterium]